MAKLRKKTIGSGFAIGSVINHLRLALWHLVKLAMSVTNFDLSATLGFDATIAPYNVESEKTARKLTTVLEWAQDAGKDTGV